MNKLMFMDLNKNCNKDENFYLRTWFLVNRFLTVIVTREVTNSFEIYYLNSFFLALY